MNKVDRKKMMADMGKRLEERRVALGWSQEQAAEAADVTQQTISNCENGNNFLQPDAILLLSLAYGISACYLLTGEVCDNDRMRNDKRVRELETDDYFHFEAMCDHFLTVALKNKTHK